MNTMTNEKAESIWSVSLVVDNVVGAGGVHESAWARETVQSKTDCLDDIRKPVQVVPNIRDQVATATRMEQIE